MKIVLALWVNETKVSSRNVLIDKPFLIKMTKNQKWTKRLSFETSHKFMTWLFNLRGRMPHARGFLEFFKLLPVFGYFLSLLDRKATFVKLWTKF